MVSLLGFVVVVAEVVVRAVDVGITVDGVVVNVVVLVD